YVLFLLPTHTDTSFIYTLSLHDALPICSSMFLLSIAGAAVAPLVVVVATYVNEPSTPFKELFYNVNLYTVLIIGAPLYGVVTTYLFNREYVENTIKNILTI